MSAQSETNAVSRPVRPLYWSLRRELWESRSIVVAPLVAAGLVLLALLVQAHAAYKLAVPSAMQSDPQTRAMVIKLVGSLSSPIALTSIVVGLIYCLDALHGERRDRSMLFWKSLPVSDFVTVLAKTLIPVLVLPLLSLVLTLAVQLIGLLAGSANLAAHGAKVAQLWYWLPLPRMALSMAYGLTAMMLWYTPIYAWLLLVSGWARRSTFLWAVLMPLGVCLLERMVFGSSHLFDLLKDRLFGWYGEAFNMEQIFVTDPLARLTPAVLVGSPGLWIGLLVAAGLFAATVWQRHRREPI